MFVRSQQLRRNARLVVRAVACLRLQSHLMLGLLQGGCGMIYWWAYMMANNARPLVYYATPLLYPTKDLEPSNSQQSMGTAQRTARCMHRETLLSLGEGSNPGWRPGIGEVCA